MHHTNQLWSQWLDVHAHYSSSGLGYVSFEEDSDHEQFEDNEPLLSTGSGGCAASNPTEASFKLSLMLPCSQEVAALDFIRIMPSELCECSYDLSFSDELV